MDLSLKTCLVVQRVQPMQRRRQVGRGYTHQRGPSSDLLIRGFRVGFSAHHREDGERSRAVPALLSYDRLSMALSMNAAVRVQRCPKFDHWSPGSPTSSTPAA